MSEQTSTSQTSPTVVAIPAVITVGDYARVLGLPVTKVMAELMRNSVMATINEQIDFETAAIIGADLGFEVTPEASAEETPTATKPELAPGEGVTRPPVVAVMGHVDHGKTSLLDAIRQTDVAGGEAGGITQHIGAYQIKRNDRWITFLDTPGHEAFSAIRAHGARLTDVAIIVVAADDGVKPQTQEAIRHAQAAGVKIVIAINKIDKPEADPNRVRQELSEQGLTPEEWGGQTVMVEVSARQGTNIDKLLDLVLLVADIEDLRAQLDVPATGVVIEAHLDNRRGAMATVLVRNGRLRLGDFMVAGPTYAKVRSLDDWHGSRIRQADPGMPAVVTGFKNVPDFGAVFEVVASEKAAKDAVTHAARQQSIKSMTRVKKIGAEELSNAITAGRMSELNVVVKADVQGSLESLVEGLGRLGNDEVVVKITHSGVGNVSESDVTMAKAAKALILGFNVSLSGAVHQLAVRERVEVRLYKVIYELLDDIRNMLEALLAPETVETEVGRLEVLGVFKTTKTAVICGGRVTSGKIEPKLKVRIKHDGAVIGTGTLSSLQKDKQAAKAVFEGDQCGLDLATTAAVVEGDELEFFSSENRARHL